MTADPRRPTIPRPVPAPAAKRPYTPPRLTAHGSVPVVTQVGDTDGSFPF